MNFIIRCRTHNFLLLTLILLSLAVVFITTGALRSSAETNNNQESRENKSSAQNWRRRMLVGKETFGKETFGRFDSPTKRFAAPFSQTMKSLLEASAVGDLDTTFGAGGKVTTRIGNSQSEALAAAVQTDGKTVAAGYSFNTADADFALARYNADGSLDASFGAGGKVTTDFGGDNFILALVIQPADGKLVAAGSSSNGANDDFALARYNTDGTLDASFGTGGKVTTDFGGNSSDYIDGVALQADGKIIAAGYRFNGSFFHFALARYNADGSLDASFGAGGKIITMLTAFDDLARAVVIQTDGKIVVAGEANADFAVARYNSDGTLDSSFGTGGTVITSINVFDSAYDVVLQADGKILAAGESGDGNNADFALLRYTSSGALDSTFGAGGIVTTAIGAGDEIASSLAAQASGKIIVGGFSFNGANADFALARYNTDGSLDGSFGTGGKILTDFGGGAFDYINALVLQSNNRVIGFGSSNSNFAAAAYVLETANCSYSLSPLSASFPSGGGTGSFNVSAPNGCSYTAVSSVSWITITSGASGSGNGFVGFSVAANSGASRTGTITVGGQTFTIGQAAFRRKKILLSPL